MKQTNAQRSNRRPNFKLGSAAGHHCCSSSSIAPPPAFGPTALPWPAAQPICLEPTSQLALQGTAPLPSPDLILDLHRVHGVGFDAITPDALPAIRPHAWEGALDVLFLPSHSLAAWAPCVSTAPACLASLLERLELD